MTRKCPNCQKWELEVVIPEDSPLDFVGDYFFLCNNCSFHCGKTEANKYPSYAVEKVRSSCRKISKGIKN